MATTGIRAIVRTPSSASRNTERRATREARPTPRTDLTTAVATATNNAPPKNSGDGPTDSRSKPALSAPRRPTERTPSACRPTALAAWRRPTMSPMSAWVAGISKVCVDALSTTSSNSGQMLRSSPATTPPMPTKTAARPRYTAMSSRRRSTRSAIAPARRPSSRLGALRRANDSAARNTEPVASSTNHPIARRSIQVLKATSTDAIQSRRKAGSRNARRAGPWVTGISARTVERTWQDSSSRPPQSDADPARCRIHSPPDRAATSVPPIRSRRKLRGAAARHLRSGCTIPKVSLWQASPGSVRAR